MDELVRWLEQQLTEDERIVRAATPGPWRAGVRSGLDVVDGDGWTVCNASDVDADHIARHDPARVLREIDTKRQLLNDHPIVPRTIEPTVINGKEIGGPHFPFGCQNCHAVHDTGEVYGFGYCFTVKVLALPYADRPGYKETWRP